MRNDARQVLSVVTGESVRIADTIGNLPRNSRMRGKEKIPGLSLSSGGKH